MPIDLNELALYRTADGSYTLKHPHFPETYHSRFGAVTEAVSVFLQNSGVQHKLQNSEPASVLEIGFGSGLNFMLTAACARENQCQLNYVAYENQLPPLHLITELLQKNTPDCEAEITQIQSLLTGSSVHRQPVNRYCIFSLIASDAVRAELDNAAFDAVYLDAFSVAQNPLLWGSSFLKVLRGSLKPHGRLATYSVNRRFKDALTSAGFEWQKIPGPKGKREVIVASP